MALKRLRMNGVTIEGACVAREDGVRLTEYVVSDDGQTTTLASSAALRVEKHALVVSPNPAFAEILGYMPGFQAVLTGGFDGPLTLTIKKLSATNAQDIKSLDWIADVFMVPISILPLPD